MKTIDDFKVINGVGILEGVAYAEEAKVVEEFLRKNSKIMSVSVITKDGRYFELSNGKLILSKEKKFLNPYYIQEKNELFDKIEENEETSTQKDINSLNLIELNKSTDFDKLEKLDLRILSLENNFVKNEKLLTEIISLIESSLRERGK